MKNLRLDRLDWKGIPDGEMKARLKKRVSAMRRQGLRVQLNAHGAGRFSVVGFIT